MNIAESRWPIYLGTGVPHDRIKNLPPSPPWRTFHGVPFEIELPRARQRARLEIGQEEIDLINAALFLRRPILVTGKPGAGKSSLAHAIAYELGLGPAMIWSINTRSSLQDGLYRYDAIGRLQEGYGLDEIGRYIRLGPLGTALIPTKRPRVLLIDEIDKSDLDFPNDLLNVFEDGQFEIPELSRLEEKYDPVNVKTLDRGLSVPVTRGIIECFEFPIVVMTSNGERDFPPPFLRRCIRIEMRIPDDDRKLERIVESHFGKLNDEERMSARHLISEFLTRCDTSDIATDQLLNAIYLVTKHRVDKLVNDNVGDIINAVMRELK